MSWSSICPSSFLRLYRRQLLVLDVRFPAAPRDVARFSFCARVGRVSRNGTRQDESDISEWDMIDYCLVLGVCLLALFPGVYIIESLLIPPPAFDFLPRDASRHVFISMIFLPI